MDCAELVRGPRSGVWFARRVAKRASERCVFRARIEVTSMLKHEQNEVGSTSLGAQAEAVSDKDCITNVVANGDFSMKCDQLRVVVGNCREQAILVTAIVVGRQKFDVFFSDRDGCHSKCTR